MVLGDRWELKPLEPKPLELKPGAKAREVKLWR